MNTNKDELCLFRREGMMKKLKINLPLSLLSFLFLTGMTHADHEHRNRDRHRHSNRHLPNDHRHDRNVHRIRTSIGRTLSDQKLFLGKEFRMHQYSGKSIHKVILNFRGMYSGGTMYLMVNGKDVGEPLYFGGRRSGQSSHSFKLNRFSKIGEDVKRLQVDIVGSVYIESAVLVLKSTHRDGPGRDGDRGRSLVSFPNEYVRGIEALNLSDLSYASYSQSRRPIRFVELDIDNYGDNAQIRLCNGRENHFGGYRHRGDRGRGHITPSCLNTSLIRGRGFQKLRIFAQGQLAGVPLEGLDLLARGSFTIQKIKIGF